MAMISNGKAWRANGKEQIGYGIALSCNAKAPYCKGPVMQWCSYEPIRQAMVKKRFVTIYDEQISEGKKQTKLHFWR